MIYFIAICLAVYALSAGAGCTAYCFGSMDRPWARLRHFTAAVGALVFAASAAGGAGSYLPESPIPLAQAESSDQPKMEASFLISEKEWEEPLVAPSAPPKGAVAAEEVSPQETNGYMDGSFDEEPGIHWYIHHYSALYGVDPLLVKAIIQVESRFNPYAYSSQGAMGLMQINQVTAKHLGMKNPFDVRENIEGGTRYLKTLLKRHYWDIHRALASYNAGPAAVDRFGGIPPYPETYRYVWKVINEYRNLKLVAAAFKESGLSSRPGYTRTLQVKKSRPAISGQKETGNTTFHAALSTSDTLDYYLTY
ncbi:MAG: lytic transglycosylase domain-containing protein [bacterium]